MSSRLAAVIIVFTLMPTVRAEDACEATVARLCPKSRGDLLLGSCLQQHEREIAASCKGDLEALLARARQIGKECERDAFALCRDVTPGSGRVAACLKQHEHQLSTSCQAAFNDWRMKRMELEAACAGDVAKVCQLVPEGAGRVWSCLSEHESELSGDCRSAMRKL